MGNVIYRKTIQVLKLATWDFKAEYLCTNLMVIIISALIP